MAKYLEVSEFTAPVGNEWNASAYPGNGLYVSATDDFAAVQGLTIWRLTIPGLRASLRQSQPAGGCDANRLLDQILELRK